MCRMGCVVAGLPLISGLPVAVVALRSTETMNYYKRHIGDYAAATRHLSILEHGVYTLLLDMYYTSEGALPTSPKEVCRKLGARSKDEVAAVESVLRDFFTPSDDGWRQSRCDAEIDAYERNAETNRINGRKGGRKPNRQPAANPMGSASDSKLEPEPNPNQEPRTMNQPSAVAEGVQGERTSPPPAVAGGLPLPVVKGKRKAEGITDEWLAEMAKRYPHVVVSREFTRAQSWVEAHPGRTLNRPFLVNWLNRIEPPPVVNGSTVPANENF